MAGWEEEGGRKGGRQGGGEGGRGGGEERGGKRGAGRDEGMSQCYFWNLVIYKLFYFFNQRFRIGVIFYKLFFEKFRKFPFYFFLNTSRKSQEKRDGKK